MASNVYETMFILDSNRYARDPGGVSGAIPEMIESSGGKILANRLYAEQKLAYPIEGHQKGTYWLTYFEMPATGLNDFYRKCQLNESVLRQLTLKLDPRLVEVMVAHARGDAARRETDEGADQGENREPVAAGAES